mgnify:CR=1 FL=1
MKVLVAIVFSAAAIIPSLALAGMRAESFGMRPGLSRRADAQATTTERFLRLAQSRKPSSCCNKNNKTCC